MSEQQPTALILMTDDAGLQAHVDRLVHSNGQFRSPLELCRNLSELLIRLERNARALVLIDLDSSSERLLEELEQLVGRYSQARFVVLSDTVSPPLFMQAMQAGVRHVQAKASMDSELYDALKRLVQGSPGGWGQSSSVITLLSAGGGCGSTTLAINLAHELMGAGGSPALIIDADDAYGAVGSYLGLQGQYGLADVLADRSRIDRELIQSTALPAESGVHVLLSPASTHFGRNRVLSYENLDLVVASARRGYRHVVIDAPRLPGKAPEALALLSDIVLIVMQMSVKDIQVGKMIARRLQGEGFPEEKLLTVINRYEKRRTMIDLDSARLALNNPRLVCIQNDYRNASRSINYGKPLAEIAPRSGLKKDLSKLAVKLTAQREIQLK